MKSEEMAESRGSLLAKSVQKHAGRAKEKLLQNLGKVDRTADEIFDEHLLNFTRQQNAANRLQKEFNNYIRCIRAAQAASKSLLEAIGETYESQWTGHDLLYVQTQSVDMLWQDFSHKLADQVLLPLNTYQAQFPEMRKKIDKRGRKLVDYDSQRHNFQALQTNMKKRDDAKMQKGREQLEEAKRTYEMLNSELHDELPALYDSRILFLVTNLQSLFNSEHIFHSEAAKVFGELEAVVDKLATDSQRGSYSVKKTNGASLPRPTSIKNTPELIINNTSSYRADDLSPTKKDSQSPQTQTNLNNSSKPTTNNSDAAAAAAAAVTTTTPSSPPPSEKQPSKKSVVNNNNNNNNSVSSSPEQSPSPPPPVETEKTNGVTVPDGKSKSPSPEPVVAAAAVPATLQVSSNNNSSSDNDKKDSNEDDKKVVAELYDIPVGASTDNLPPGVLYRVKATYKYTREDVDELSFEVGEIISVVEYDDPEEQEEGWLMGIKDNGEKGMFPANFTRPL